MPEVESQPIRSPLASDPEMRELVEMFVSELSERVAALSEAYHAANFDRLRTLVHQLKGASGGYGFAPLGEAAGRVEEAVPRDGFEASPRLREEFDRLINMCRSATAD